MHTTQANFSNDAIAQAIAGAQATIERLPFMGNKVRKAQHEYTVKAVFKAKGKGAQETQVIDHYIAYDEADAMSQFADDYGIRATAAYRTKLSR